GARLGRTCLADGGHPADRRSARQDVPTLHRQPRPAPRRKHLRVFLTRNEAEREGRKGDSERKSLEVFVGLTPDRPTYGANRVLARVVGNLMRDRRNAPLRTIRKSRRLDLARVLPP